MSPETVERRQTTRFIAENPSEVVLQRNIKVPDGAGGFTKTPTPLDPQVMRVVQRAQGQAERRNASGEVVRPTIVLVCEWDADIQNDDTFTWDGLDCEVVWVTDLRYVKHGEVSTR